MRKCDRHRASRTALFAAAAAVVLPAVAWADVPINQFIPGDYLVIRGGDPGNSDASGAPDSSGEVNTYMDEYTQSGYYVCTLDIPEMTLPGAGASSHEGNLDISPNGQWISFAGYDPVQNPAGITPHATDGTENAVIGEINLLQGPSSLNASTMIAGTANFPNSLTGQYVHSALTINGNEFYIGGKYNQTAGGQLESSDTGLLYINGTGASAPITVLEGGVDWRNIADFNGQLYGATGSSSVGTHGAYTIGNGLPTTNNPVPAHTEITDYPGGQSASSLAFVDIPTSDTFTGTSNGFNVLYTVGDQSVGGITKYYYNAATSQWIYDGAQVSLTASGNIVNPTGLIATVDPTNPDWVDLTISGNNGVYTYIDKSGDPKTTLPENAFTQSITPPGYAAFYGMTQDPGPANLTWANSATQAGWDQVSTNWSYAGGTIAFANGDNVTFDDSTRNTLSVALNQVVQPGSVTVNATTNNYTITGAGGIAGAGVLRLLPGNASTFTLATSNSYTGGTIVDGGTLVLAAAGALPGGGSVVNNATVTVQANNVAGNVSGTGTLNITTAATLKLASSTGPDAVGGVGVSTGSTLDLTNNTLLIEYGAADPVSAISSYLASGFTGGTWSGTGITSSAVAYLDSTQKKLDYSIGYADGADGVSSLPSGEIEIMPTLAGDAKLQGNVVFGDFQILAQYFGKSGGWDEGNFTYGPTIDFGDFQLLAQDFGSSVTGLSAGEAAALNNFAAAFGDQLVANADGVGFQVVAVPEPASVGLAASIAMVTLIRRRRRVLG